MRPRPRTGVLVNGLGGGLEPVAGVAQAGKIHGQARGVVRGEPGMAVGVIPPREHAKRRSQVTGGERFIEPGP